MVTLVARSLLFIVGMMIAGCGDDDGPAPDTGETADTSDASDTAETSETPEVADGEDADETADETDAGPELLLHVPSPDWAEQVIYFVFTDRFENGDPSNDDQGAGEYDPTRTSHYSGGDLQGVIDRLDYIAGLGATAVWVTPPVANQWWDPLAEFGGFHGYWARDFTAVDEHQGTLATYRALSDALHRRDMFLIQDIVVNHTGNFFSWDGPYDPDDPATNAVLNPGSLPTAAPTQAPFDRNDPTDPEDRALGIYHWTPAISDYTDPVQEKTWQISDLDDLATDNPVVREALRDSYAHWIREVGVDGFRVDTAKFVEVDFFNDFVHGDDPAHPGMALAAAATGRDDFLTFGEVFDVSAPLDDAGDRKVASYLGSPEAPALRAVLAFPLYEELGRVIGGGRATELLAYRLERFMDPSLYPDPYVMPTFVDNHDVQRFVAAVSPDALMQALTVLFTIPGIPVIFQGTEQGFGETRAAMFAEGWMSGGVDHFDPNAELYRFIASLAELRRTHPALTRGDLTVLEASAAGPGVIAWRRALPGDGGAALVALNTAEEAVLLSGLATGLAPGGRLDVAFARGDEGVGPALFTGPDGALVPHVMPARSALVLQPTTIVEPPPPPAVTITVTTPLEGAVLTEDTVIAGTVDPPATSLRVVLDDYLERAATVTPAADGTWSATLPVSQLPYGDNLHTLTIYAPADNVASPRYTFTTSTVFDGVIASFPDPIGDDTGPSGTYGYPQDATFSAGRSMDIEEVVAEVGATTLRLKIRIGEISTVWNPANLFDHVCFNVYFDAPALEGLAMLPKIQATAPDGFMWDFMHFAYGWGNSLHKTQGASETDWGDPAIGRPKIAVDRPTRTITFEYATSSFGLPSWEGVSVYVTTWDFDGIDARYRPLSPSGGPWTMSGGEPTDPYVMDELGPVALPLE